MSDSSNSTADAATTGAEAVATVNTRRCWRCLQQFPTDPQDGPVRAAEWWVCTDCHDALFTRSRTGAPAD
jgi:hypothetical protein